MNLTELPELATSKLTVMLGAGYGATASLLGSVATGIAHDNAALAAIMTAAAAVLGGLVAKLPDIMRAKSESRSLEVTMQDKGQETFIKHIYDNMERERGVYERTTAELRAALARADKENVILRASKHTAINECHRMVLEFTNLMDDCRRKGMDVMPFNPPDLGKIIRDEDSRMEQVAGVPASTVNLT